jgi:lipopolysaccharide transport system permease protein
MIYGISLILSSINLFFRDMEKLVSLLMTFVFYFTPIIYPVSMIPEKYQYLINFNPLAPLIINWKNLFLNGTLDSVYLVLSLAYSIVFFTVGHLIYKKLSWRFAEVL